MTGEEPRLTSTGFMRALQRTPGKADRAGGAAITSAGAHQRVGRFHVRMEMPVVVEMRHLGAQQSAHGFQRRAGCSGAWKSQPCAAASNSMPITAVAFSTMGSSRRAPCAAIETWSSWLAEVGIESTLAG